jgi:hypothetical protein
MEMFMCSPIKNGPQGAVFFSTFFAEGGFGLTLGIGFADHTRLSASSKGIAGASSFFSGGVLVMSNPSDPLGDLYDAIGFIVTAWSYIEQSLDACIAIAFSFPGATAIDKSPPINTKRKVQFMRQALDQLPQLAPFKNVGLPILERVMNIKDYRHELVHSVLQKPTPENGVYSYMMLKVRPDGHHQKHWKFDLKAFPTKRQTLEVLATDLLAFSQHMIGDLVGTAQRAP